MRNVFLCGKYSREMRFGHILSARLSLVLGAFRSGFTSSSQEPYETAAVLLCMGEPRHRCHAAGCAGAWV